MIGKSFFCNTAKALPKSLALAWSSAALFWRSLKSNFFLSNEWAVDVFFLISPTNISSNLSSTIKFLKFSDLSLRCCLSNDPVCRNKNGRTVNKLVNFLLINESELSLIFWRQWSKAFLTLFSTKLSLIYPALTGWKVRRTPSWVGVRSTIGYESCTPCI